MLLDALRDHLGVVHGLADGGHYDPVTVSCGPGTSLRYSRKCRHLTIADWRWDRGSEQLTSHFADAPHTVLLPVSIRAVEWAVRNQEMLRQQWKLIPLPSPCDFDIAKDKLRLANLAQDAGLPVPPFAPLAELAESDAQGLSFPVLLKPRCGYGGSGIVRVETQRALEEQLLGMTTMQNYFAQTVIEGQDLSCGVFCRDGEVLASVPYVPLAREGHFGRFTSIETVDDPDVEQIVGRLMKALRWNGIANIDLIRSRQGDTYILEVNPRCWANMAAVIPLGLDFAGMLCQAALGRAMPSQRCRRGRVFGALDTIALLRATIFDRTLRRQLGWQRILSNESLLRTTVLDPFPWLAEVFRYGLIRGARSMLGQLRRHSLPALERSCAVACGSYADAIG